MADWTRTADDRLRALWAEGHSTAEIGRRMGLSKNAIVGRAHRLNLPKRANPIVPGPAALTDAQRATLRGLVARGYGTKALAATMQVPRDLVRREMAGLGLAPPSSMAGAAALRRARRATETLRAEAFRRHAQPGGGELPTGPAAQRIPAAAGIPARAGQPGAVVDTDGGSSLTLPPAEATPRPGVLLSSGGARSCRWPMWGDTARPTGVFCEAPVRRKRDGAPCVYCAVHAARAFTNVAEPVADEPPHRVTHRSFAWGGRAA